jgi:hypothetical protein
MLSIPLSALEIVLPYGLAIAFLLWFLWNLLRESRH